MSSHVRPAGVVSCPGRARIVMSLTWTLVTVTLAQLHPWEGNPKTTTRKQAGQLVTSRDDLGQFQTVAISPFDAAGLALVYDGHQRMSAWRQAYGPDFTIQALQASRPLTAQEQRKATPSPRFSWKR